MGLTMNTSILAIAMVTSSGHLFGPWTWKKSLVEEINKLSKEKEFPDRCTLLILFCPSTGN